MADTTHFHDFDAALTAKREAAGLGPSFRLGGETWQCTPVQSAIAVRELVGTENSVEATFVYLRRLIVPAQREAFDEKVVSNEDIDLETLSEVVSWLSEEYTARPTKPASPSA